MVFSKTCWGNASYHIPRIAIGISALIIVMAAYAGSASAAGQLSKNIGYVNYDDSGFTENSVATGNIFATSVVNGSASTSLTNDSVIYNNMTFTPLTKASLSSTTLAPYDTLILFEVCDIATSLNASQHAAINDYLAKGNKIILYDADRCAPSDGGVADYSWFTYPFSTSSPGPQGNMSTLTIVENSTLTSGLASDPFDKDELGDANTVTTSDTHWDAAANTTNALGNYGYFLAYARNSGLIIYDGADHWYTAGPTKSLTDLFLNELNQQFNPDKLPGTIPIAPTVHITANPATHDINVSTNFTFTANPAGSWGNNISYSWSVAYDKCSTIASVLPGQSISENLDVACGNATISVIAEDEKKNNASDTYLVTVHENATSPPSPIVTPVLTTITVSPSTAMLNVTETQLFTATALDQNNTPMSGINISWTISNSTVGSVTPLFAVTGMDGNASTTFTASAAGTTTVTAINGTVSASSDVTVAAVTPTPIPTTPIPPVLGIKTQPTVVLIPPTGLVGDWVQGLGSGWPPNQLVDVFWDGNSFAFKQVAGNVPTNDNGGFIAYFKVPEGAAPGSHVVRFTMQGIEPPVTVDKTFQVISTISPVPIIPAPTTPTPTEITVTGKAWCSSSVSAPFAGDSECSEVWLHVPKYDYFVGDTALTKGITPANKLGKWITDKPNIDIFAEGADFTLYRVPVPPPDLFNPFPEVDATLFAYFNAGKGFTCTKQVKLSRFSDPYTIGSPFGTSVSLLKGPWTYLHPAYPGLLYTGKEGCQAGRVELDALIKRFK